MNFLLALSFLTALPVPLCRIMTEEDLGHSTRWFPVVGMIIGGLLWSVYSGGSLVLSKPVAAVLTLALWAWITRGLHLDGLADTFDGLGGGVDRERALEIMKDSRIGTFGAISLFLILAMKGALLASLDGPGSVALFLSPIFGRWGLVLSVFFFPPARKDGMGRRFTGSCGLVEVVVASILVILSLFPAGWMGVALLVGAGVAAISIGLRISAKLGGLTGDSYGCVCEMTEVVVLVLGSLLWGSRV